MLYKVNGPVPAGFMKRVAQPSLKLGQAFAVKEVQRNDRE